MSVLLSFLIKQNYVSFQASRPVRVAGTGGVTNPGSSHRVRTGLQQHAGLDIGMLAGDLGSGSREEGGR